MYKWISKLFGNQFESEEIGRKRQLEQARYIDTDELVYDIRIIDKKGNTGIGVLWHDNSIRHVKIIGIGNLNIGQNIKIKVDSLIADIVE